MDKIDTGATALILVSAALVFVMTPGLDEDLHGEAAYAA